MSIHINKTTIRSVLFVIPDEFDPQFAYCPRKERIAAPGSLNFETLHSTPRHIPMRARSEDLANESGIDILDAKFAERHAIQRKAGGNS
jgi:hypothetical protein